MSLPLFIVSISIHAQSLTGIWKGYFISDGGETYKLEFQINQSGANVTGVSYSYLDVRFYGKATMTGNFIKPSLSFRIREIKTVEVKSILGGATCIMNYNFVYSKSGREEFLDGTYLGKYETKYKTDPPPTWGDCGGGKVYLRKVTTSDFYLEPFLRNKVKSTSPVIVNEPPRKKDSASILTKKPLANNKNSGNKPLAKTNPQQKNTTNKSGSQTKPLTKTNNPVNNPTLKKPDSQNNDSLKKILSQSTRLTPPKTIITPDVLKTRTNELVKTLVVNDSDVLVKLYDNGEIDGDTISVYLDKRLVLSKKGLTASPLTVKLKMDEENSEHELIMVAENLGRIPPNTSLMIVESGDDRYDVRITSTEQKNALVRFKYQKKVAKN